MSAPRRAGALLPARRAPPPPRRAAAASSAASTTSSTTTPARPADDFARFAAAAAAGANLVPLFRRVMGDQLTPVLAYRRLVAADDREAPSFLFESVVGGDQQGRWSFLGARPALEVVAHGARVDVLDHRAGRRARADVGDPLGVPAALSAGWRPAPAPGLPDVFTGGWVGYVGYDTVRYVYGGKSWAVWGGGGGLAVVWNARSRARSLWALQRASQGADFGG
jgi:anthranilate synthase component 1